MYLKHSKIHYLRELSITIGAHLWVLAPVEQHGRREKLCTGLPFVGVWCLTFREASSFSACSNPVVCVPGSVAGCEVSSAARDPPPIVALNVLAVKIWVLNYIAEKY